MRSAQIGLIAFGILVCSALPALAQTAMPARISPHEVIGAHIGKRGGSMMIVYGRPYSKDSKSGEIRKIWGGLIPWDSAWRMGADEATVMIIAQPIVMGDTTLPAGAYTLFMVPKEDGSAKLIINKKIGQWGVPYVEAKEKDNEIARIDLTKDTAPDKQVDQYTMAIVPDKTTGGGTIKMVWENTAFAMPFTLGK